MQCAPDHRIRDPPELGSRLIGGMLLGEKGGVRIKLNDSKQAIQYNAMAEKDWKRQHSQAFGGVFVKEHECMTRFSEL